MNKYVKLVGFGFLSWLVPFLASFAFFGPEGLMIDLIFFKSIMIVVGALVGVALMVAYFKQVKQDFLKEAVILGFGWFAVNLVLDWIVLLPMSGSDPVTHFLEIGMRYLVLPIIAVGFGLVLKR